MDVRKRHAGHVVVASSVNCDSHTLDERGFLTGPTDKYSVVTVSPSVSSGFKLDSATLLHLIWLKRSVTTESRIS